MYNNVLVAVELGADTPRQVLEAARELVGPEAERRVLFVFDSHYLQYFLNTLYDSAFLETVEASICEQATEELAELCQPYLIDAKHQLVRIGHPAAEIRAAADEFGCDLVILGTHGRRGWRRVLGSTAGDLLHGAGFDVYMSKVSETALPAESKKQMGFDAPAEEIA